jgi:hypothetical protein
MGHLIVACRAKNLKTAFASVHLSAREGFQANNLYEVLGATDKRNSCSGNSTFEQLYAYMDKNNMYGAGQQMYIYFG